MATVTVPSGSFDGGSVTLTFATTTSASLATSLLSSVYAAAQAGKLVVGEGTTAFTSTTPGAVGLYVIDNSSGTNVTVPAGYTYVVDAETASGAVTISGNGAPNEVIVAGNGGYDFFNEGSGTGTIIGGGSPSGTINQVISTAGFTSLGDPTVAAFLTSGTLGSNQIGVVQNATVSGTASLVFGSTVGSTTIDNTGGANTIIAGTGASTISANAAGGLYFAGNGATSSLSFVNSAASTLVAGAGSITVSGSSSVASSLLFGGSGQLLYSNGASSGTVVAGTGSTTVDAGAGNGVFFGPSNSTGTLLVTDVTGSTTVIGGSAGNVSVVAAAGAALVIGGASGTTNFVTAGTGSELINSLGPSSASIHAGSGTDVIFLGAAGSSSVLAGSGAATILGGSSETFQFVNNQAGGATQIYGYGGSDSINLSGYGSAGIVSQGPSSGNYVITLSDKTSITLIGVTSPGSTIHSS